MQQRMVRYADLVPCRTAFIDTRTPGSTEKENFTIIGAGVSESADQHVHITEAHGFNIGGARQPFGCTNSQHSHETAEVFIVHSGRWRVLFGPNREDGSIEIGPGDVASAPINMFRGFDKIDAGPGFMFFVLGEDDPGKVTWAPAVFEAAADHGLKLARGGRLIDTSNGVHELKDVELEDVIDHDSLTKMVTPSMERLTQCMVTANAIAAHPGSPLAAAGVEEAGIIVPRPTSDGFPAGPISGWWPQAFNLRRLTLQTGAYVPFHSRAEPQVLMVHEGMLEVSWEGEGEDCALFLGAGDTLTIPIGLRRAFRNTTSVPAVVFVAHGTDDPAMPLF